MNFVPEDACCRFCRAWVQVRDVVQAVLSCLVPTLLFPLILSQPLHSENTAGANEQQSTAMQAAVVSLREHPEMWHGA